MTLAAASHLHVAAAPTRRESAAPRNVGVIGRGRIARPVIDALRAGEIPGWRLSAVLATSRKAMPAASGLPLVDREGFFALPLDLVIEAAGPAALAQHGARALVRADVWTVSAAALADPGLFAALEQAGRAAGHRLRIVPGALAGLDGVGMAAVDPAAELQLDFELPAGGAPASFAGSVREAAAHYPNEVNVAVAAALAGPGLDAARIRIHGGEPGSTRRLQLRMESRFGRLQAAVEPRVAPGSHPVAASLIAALRQATRTIWVG